jgi:hypothetical protein
MNTAARIETKAAAPTPRPEVRNGVAKVLTQSSAFARLPPATRQQVARDTALIADYLAAPEGIEGQKIPGGVGMPAARALDDPPQFGASDAARKAVTDIANDGEFKAGAAREGANVAGLLMKQVNFPTFVASLIEGVFHAIVKASIEQMQAYAKMIAAVAQSLQQFRDDNVTENQGRDHMAEKFPDMFEIGVDDFSDNPQPRLKLRDGVDESAALKRVNNTINFEGGALKSMDLSDEDVEKALVTAARTQLARQRQQLMASLVLMGINRIVVTDGKISAKVMYDFHARDTRRLSKSAAAYDYAHEDAGGPWGGGGQKLATTRTGEDSSGDESGAESFLKGTSKYEDKPVMTAMSAASEASESALQTRAQLAGSVEVNFKSDYLPLDKMATPGMIAAIQGNSTPVDPNVMPSARNPQAPAQTGQVQPAQASTPAPPPK